MPINFINAEPSGISSFSIILILKIKLVASLYLCSWCIVIVSVLCSVVRVPWVNLQCVSVVFLYYTHFFIAEIGT